MPPTVWVDQNGSNPGSELDAANLNADTAADTTEAATNDTLGAGSTYVNNLNRIRYQLAQFVGGAWNAAVQMIPLSQKGAPSGVASLDVNGYVAQPGGVNPVTAGLANGVATLDANSHLAQLAAKGIRQLGWAYASGSDAYIGSGYQNSGMTFSAPWGTMFNSANMVLKGALSWGAQVPAANGTNYYMNITTTGGDLLVVVMCSMYNFISVADWVEIASVIDGGNLSYIDGGGSGPDIANMAKPSIPVSGYETFAGMSFHVGLSAGTHTIVPAFKAGGGGGVTQAVGFNPNADGGKSYFNMIVLELA